MSASAEVSGVIKTTSGTVEDIVINVENEPGKEGI